MFKGDILYGKINLTPAELSNQLKNIDAQKLLDSASPIRYNFQQTPIPKIENPMVKEQQKSNNKLDAIQYENMKLNAQIETQNKLIDTCNTKIDELQTTNNNLKEINQTLIDNNKHYWIYSTIITIIGAVVGFLLGKYFA